MTGPHPLEPLGPDELAQAVTVLRDAGHLPQRTDIIDLSLHEPPRDAVQGWAAGAGAPPREAFSVTFQRGEGLTHETVISLADGQVTSRRLIEGVQPAISEEEFEACGDAALADPDAVGRERSAVAMGVDAAADLDRIVYATGINVQRDIAAVRRLIERRVPVDAADLADPAKPLNALLKAKA